jgi:transcriptional regulator with PAS, ATPase and Fis domain
MGEGEVRRVDVRVLSATNAPLADMVEAGTFRSDLFYRINVVEARIPPLRERREDIFEIIAHYFSELECEAPAWAAETRAAIDRYSWPGNIRELFNELSRVMALFGHPPHITPDMLSERITAELTNTRVKDMILHDAPLAHAVSHLEVSLLTRALTQSNWNKSKTARALGLSRQGLLKKIKRYGISRESFGVAIDDAT